MSDIREIYQEVILDHNKKPHNFRKMENPTRFADGHNPLCGDRCTVYLKIDGDKLSDVSFEGNGCAISKASASIMTTIVKGRAMSDAERLVERFRKLVSGENLSEDDRNSLGKLEVFSGVSEFPARVKCASLAWHTLKAALRANHDTVSTEEGP
jgi:nitrogen fixation protein NifU and related proteins